MLRKALHTAFSIALWFIFFYYWRIVLRQPMNPDTRTALAVLAVLTALAIGYLIWWIHHNLRIHRTWERRRRRRSVPLKNPERDYLGRILVFERPEALEESHYIEVETKHGFVGGRWVERKIFKPREENGVKF